MLSKVNKIMISLVLLLAAIIPSLPVGADSTNLVANPGFEIMTNPGTPDNWTSNTWGSNTASFNGEAAGHTGSYAAQTTVSNYSDGDAKWMFTPVDVISGESYTYSDWYTSTTATNIWAQFQTSTGQVSSQWIGSVNASSAWQQITKTFTVPANVTKASIYHVLSANGQLTIDDVSFSHVDPCTGTSVNGLTNGGFEQTCATNPSTPIGWQSQTYGPDPVTYGLTTDAHSGASAATLTTTSGNDEAGWTTTIPSPLANQRYALNFWQKGTTYVYAYVIETLSDGTQKTTSLMSVPSTAGIFGTYPPSWSEYNDVFITQSTVQSLKIVIATSGQGSLSLDDVAFTPLNTQTPATFVGGMVSITFDDGDASQYQNGRPTMVKNGFTGTYYLNAGLLSTSGYMNPTQVRALASQGNEIGSHFYHHSDMVQMDQATLVSELTGNTTALNKILGSNVVTDFASPYGSYTSPALQTVMQYEHSHRTTDDQLNTKANLNLQQIHAYLVRSTTTTADIQNAVNEALNQHAWLVLVYHGISTNASTGQEPQYTVTPTQFSQQLSVVKKSGLPVKTLRDALTSLSTQ